jgi:thermitase
MIAYIYTASFVIAAVGLVGWFLFQKTKIGSKASILFFGGMLAYLASLFLAPMLMPMKVMVLARDFTVLAGVGFLFSFFKYNRIIAAGAVVVLSMAFGMFYLELLQDTIPNRRLLTIENDSNAEILIEVKEGAEIGQIQTIIDKYNLTYERAFSNLTSPEITDLDDYYTINIPDNQLTNIDEIKNALRETATVEYLENNEIVQLDDSEGGIQKSAKKLIPNDEFIQNQWGFDLTASGELHAFLKAKNIQPKKRALIAILDTGVDAQHEDLKENFKSINARHDTDKQAHGTHCAGIAAAVSYNNKGIASVISDNQFVQVTSVKVLNDYGRGTQQGIIKGILEAADNGADVISMSLGGPSSDSRQRAYAKAFEYARKKGAIVIAAAGNSSDNAKNFVPASVKGVIAVSAVDNQLNKAVFSNTVNDVKMGIAAPGVDIFSTIPDNRYASFNGTSMACPHVAGLVGLMKSLEPDLTTQAAYDILNNTGIDTEMTKMTGKFIQADKAIKAVYGGR